MITRQGHNVVMQTVRKCVVTDSLRRTKRSRRAEVSDTVTCCTSLNHEEPAVPVSFTIDNLRSGVLLKRYKRFLADVLLDGETEPVVVHCPNTGPMTGLLDRAMAPVLVSTSTNAKRKYRHTLELIQPEEGGSYVGVHSASANAIVASFLSSGIFSSALPHVSVCREVAITKSKDTRIDFVLEGENGKPVYVEVKSVTLAEELSGGKRIALFPDTVSKRALRHTQHLTQLARDGQGAALVYVIQRGDCTAFAPCHSKDPDYGLAVLDATKAGVQVLALRCSWQPSPCRTAATLTFDSWAQLDLTYGLPNLVRTNAP